jgi:hypothetical protein
MIIRYLTCPLRLALGLPPVYGITIRNRALQLLRQIGLYRGPIHWSARVKSVAIRGR